MLTLEWLRQFRLGEYAIFDLVVSFVGITLLSPLLSKLFKKLRLDIPKRSWIIWTLPLSIFVHLIFSKFTPMTKYFFDPSGHYILKILIITMVVGGLIGIKKIPAR
ncbi:MAG: hypothetical protein WCT40_04485 [Candidatus Magasanikbacteria bacterium]|jgi:hypothetical protein